MPVQASTSFTCEVVPERQRVRVVPAGELDLETTPELDRTVRELLASGFGQILVDLAGVEFIDSTGVHVLLALSAEADARGCRIALRPGPPAVQRIFELTGTRPLLPFESKAR